MPGSVWRTTECRWVNAGSAIRDNEEMPMTYLDQNALINLGRKALGNPEFRGKIDAAIQSGALTIVLSSWHLIETANTTNLENAIKLADFMVSLRPSWLLERHNIQTLEVHEDFFRFAKVDFQGQLPIGTLSSVIAALNKEKDAPKFDIPPRAFVQQWIEHPEQLAVLTRSYKSNAEALLGMRQAVKDGKITDEIKKRTNQVFLKELMPKFTPNGLEIPREMGAEYVERGEIGSIPTLAIETAISDHEWNAQGGADRNTLIDKFHLIAALPYVDKIVSDDAFFHKMYPVAQKTGYVGAKLLTLAEFLKRF
jgi:hypothetical protein